MTSLPPERANSLRAAFRVCDVRPLVGEDIERYYVDLSEVRKTEAIEGVNTQLELQEAGAFDTILFTGHRGCGKSTELKRIESHWQADYQVIYIEADEEIDINDARYTDIYLVVIKQVEYELRKLGLKFDAPLLKSFENWFKEITQESEQTVETSVSMSGTLEAGSGPIPFVAKLLVKLLAQIKGSEKQKKTIRQTLEQDISRLKADINLLLSDALKKLRKKFPQKKGFLIIFDNLDRVPPAVGQHLFFDYASQLQELHCTVIYTVPISAIYSGQNLRNTFDSLNIVPMINIYEFDAERCDLDYDSIGLAAVTRLIERRVEVDAIFDSPQELKELAQASGGHVRQLMQMMRTTCRTAMTRKHDKIRAEDVLYAIRDEQFNFERLIPREHYPILAQVCLTKNITEHEQGPIMLFNTSVLEYNGNSRWNYVNPVVKQSDVFQRALRDAQGGVRIVDA